MNTPWGKSDSKTNIIHGVSWVGTPSHGGLAVTVRAATAIWYPEDGTRQRQMLSSKALKLADRKGSYFFFEEDCLYAIAFYEHPEWKRALELQIAAANNGTYVREADAEIKADMERVIRRWFPAYFAEADAARLEREIPCDIDRHVEEE